MLMLDATNLQLYIGSFYLSSTTMKFKKLFPQLHYYNMQFAFFKSKDNAYVSTSSISIDVAGGDALRAGMR